jgi:hypothetical protein
MQFDEAKETTTATPIFPAQIHDAHDRKAWDATWALFDRHLKP